VYVSLDRAGPDHAERTHAVTESFATTLAPLGAQLVLVTTITLAVLKPCGQTRFQATDRGHLLLRRPPTPATAGVRGQHDLTSWHSGSRRELPVGS
jgi:hypothetical protein